MRHGFKSGEDNPVKPVFSSTMSIPGDQLGCYFCNDVVAPGNVSKTDKKMISIFILCLTIQNKHII
jgi:hypothetical protein